MKPVNPPPRSRREKVVDSMAKKFADRGNVQQIIVRHRRKILQSKKTLWLIIAGTVVSMIITVLVTAGVVKPPALVGGKVEQRIAITETLDLLRTDLASGDIGADQFALYCRDFLIRYDSLPQRYQTPFSTTTGDDIYRAIAGVWPSLHLRTRQVLLHDLPHIETVQKQIQALQQQGQASVQYGNGE